MMSKLIARRLVLLFVATACVPSAVWSQRYRDPYYVDNRASTPAESYSRGLADVTRSAGERNLSNSEAALNYTDARSKQLDNDLKATDTYFQKRQMNESYTAAERRPRLSDEALFRVNKQRMPDRVSASRLDSVTGEIAWPFVLQDKAFDKHRAKLEADFAERAEKGGSIGPDAYLEIRKTTEEMTSELKKLVRKYPGTDYAQARKFIKSLSYEARFPTS